MGPVAPVAGATTALGSVVSVAVTVYPVIALLPSSSGAVKLTLAEVCPVVAETAVGACGP